MSKKKVVPKKKIEINPLTGELEITADNNFSYESVPENKRLKIADNQQMAVFGEFDADGQLDLDGTLVLEE